MDAASAGCRGADQPETCRLRPGCDWLTATCDGGRVVGGCYAMSTGRKVPVDCSSGSDYDAGTAEDLGTACRSFSAERTCAQQSGCRWWAPECNGHTVESRCIPEGLSPTPPDCSDVGSHDGDAWSLDTGQAADVGHRPRDASSGRDAGVVDAVDAGGHGDATGVCDHHTTKYACRKDAACKWHVDSCGGRVVRQDCIRTGKTPAPVSCKSIRPKNCHAAAGESSCYPPNCDWVVPGCGGGSSNSLKLEACLPSKSCQRDTECPAKHRCVKLWVDPCHDMACRACSQSQKRCVPLTLLNP